MTTDVTAMKRRIDQAWDEANRTISDEIAVIVADHAARGLVRSGGTIKRIVQAVEPIARQAVLEGRKALGNRNSVVLRVKHAEFQSERIAAFAAKISARLDAVGLGDRAGKALLTQAIDRASRPEPTPKKSGRKTISALGGRVAAYVGDKVVVAILVGVAVTAIATFFKLA